jgi:glycosyltransferase involved in cell wall biosynthesis
VKISAIIPTYNRFEYLLNAVSSIKKQTHKDIEIIVINDRSTQKEYYEYDFGDIKIIHLEQNSIEKFGYPCAGRARTVGMKQASGEYIAFLDDDDSWLPQKIEKQLEVMKNTGCEMSCTESFFGSGFYREGERYPPFSAGEI